MHNDTHIKQTLSHGEKIISGKVSRVKRKEHWLVSLKHKSLVSDSNSLSKPKKYFLFTVLYASSKAFVGRKITNPINDSTSLLYNVISNLIFNYQNLYLYNSHGKN